MGLISLLTRKDNCSRAAPDALLSRGSTVRGIVPPASRELSDGV